MDTIEGMRRIWRGLVDKGLLPTEVLLIDEASDHEVKRILEALDKIVSEAIDRYVDLEKVM